MNRCALFSRILHVLNLLSIYHLFRYISLIGRTQSSHHACLEKTMLYNISLGTVSSVWNLFGGGTLVLWHLQNILIFWKKNLAERIDISSSCLLDSRILWGMALRKRKCLGMELCTVYKLHPWRNGWDPRIRHAKGLVTTCVELWCMWVCVPVNTHMHDHDGIVWKRLKRSE